MSSLSYQKLINQVCFKSFKKTKKRWCVGSLTVKKVVWEVSQGKKRPLKASTAGRTLRECLINNTA